MAQGTGRQMKQEDGWPRVFVAIFVALLLVPLVGLPLTSTSGDAEKRELAPWPALTTEDGAPNLSWLSEAGAWFEDHFALRSQLIDLDATVKESVFKTSATQNVVVGRDGWLFYTGTLANYRRTSPLSDRALDNIAYNVGLMQEWAEARGKRFVFCIAPNKNSLYPEYMPSYQRGGEGPSDLERLLPLLQERGIHYVDLARALTSTDEVLYYARDSHWTSAGAYVAYQSLMKALRREAITYDVADAQATERHVGDLDLMLHPTTAGGEAELYWPESERFSYTNEASSVEDSDIKTASERTGATGSLVAYRDSFGNALLPYLATQYATASFSKMVPYDMGSALFGDADDVVVERAERHLSFFNTRTPYFPALEREVAVPSQELECSCTMASSESGPYLLVEGQIEQGMADDGASIYLTFELAGGITKTFEAFHVGPEADEVADTAAEDDEDGEGIVDDWGYRLCVAKAALGEGGTAQVRVSVIHDGVLTKIHSRTINWEG